jgi:hypothetical protein
MFALQAKTKKAFSPKAFLFIRIAMLSFALPQAASAQPASLQPNSTSPNFTPYVWAIEYGVSDLKRAVEFYTKALGFEVEENNCCAPAKVLHNGNAKNNAAAESAQNGFEQFKKLDGQWIGRSTKGWEETITFKTIAKGSVVVENSFDAHPNETMMTMFHLDGARLLLTHYCVAGSQPRLAATAFDDNGRTVTFTFLDATNLPSRDKGHMDKAVFRFKDENNFSSQWTWYQDGKESWMEEIKYERKL